MTDERAVIPAPDGRMDFGQTDLDAADFVMPRVKVLQQMSDEANGDEPRGKPGDFYNTLTGENFGKELRFIPILPFKQRVFLVRDERRDKANAQLLAAGLAELSEGSGLKCRSLDMYVGRGEPGIECNDCPLSKWTDGNTPPLCSETYNVAAMGELGELIVLSFVRSSAKTGKRVFSMLRMRPGAPWQSIYEAKTRSQRNDKGTFYVPEVTVTKEATPTELLGQALTWAGRLKGVTLEVTPTEEDAGEEGEPVAAPF